MIADIQLRSTCRSCGASLVFVDVLASGRPIPLDAEPTPDGNVEVFETAGGLYGKVWPASHIWGEADLRYRSHFASCPSAKEHRR